MSIINEFIEEHKQVEHERNVYEECLIKLIKQINSCPNAVIAKSEKKYLNYIIKSHTEHLPFNDCVQNLISEGERIKKEQFNE